MNIVKTLLAGIVGTTTMTLFSYEASRNREKQFKEPVLLHRLMKRNRRTGSEKAGAEENRLDGWLLHYATGLLFSSVYDRVWRRTKVAPSIPAGVVLGAVSGLVGISVWTLALKLHPDPPEVDIQEYSRHLMAAHVLFGLFAALGYRLPGDENEMPPEEY